MEASFYSDGSFESFPVGVEDMITMEQFFDSTLLENIELRYHHDIIYVS